MITDIILTENETNPLNTAEMQHLGAYDSMDTREKTGYLVIFLTIMRPFS